MKLYTISFKTATYNQNRSYPQNANRHATSLAIKGTMQDVMGKIEELACHNNVRMETLKIIDNTGVIVYRCTK